TEVLSDGEKELEYALAFDHVNAAKYEDLGQVTSDLKAVLKIRSAERVKKSADFAKLQKEMDEIKARKERKAFPLNEQELKDQFAKDGTDKTDPKENLLSEPMADGKPYKFERNFTNNEVLQIMQDLLQGKKLVSER